MHDLLPHVAAPTGSPQLTLHRDGAPIAPLPAIDGYHVERRIGGTPTTETFLARHRATNAAVECTTLRSRAINDDAAVIGQVMREAVEAMRVTHPSIAAVDQIGFTTDGRAYVSTMRPPGVPLSALVIADGALDPRRAVRVALEVATALDVAHQCGIVHGDLTPERVFVGESAADLGERVTVQGLGLATLRHASLLRAAPPAVELPYASPERRAGEVPDARSDVYSLASVLVKAVTGRAPTIVQGDSAADVAPRGAQHALPPTLAAVIARARATDAAARHASLAELRDDLLAAEQALAADDRAELAGEWSAPGGAAHVAPDPVPLELATPLPIDHAGAVDDAWAVATATGEQPVTGVATAATPSRQLLWGAMAAVGALSVVSLGQSLLAPKEGGPAPAPVEAAAAPAGSEASRASAAGSVAATRSASSPPRAGPTDSRSSAADRAATGASSVSGARTGAPDGGRARDTRAAPAASATSATSATSVVEPEPEVGGGPGKTPLPEVVVPDVAVRASVAAAGASTLARGALAEVTRAARIGELDSALRMRDRPVVVDARTRAEVGATVGRFARALEARDLDALRRVYPGLSTTERSTWAAFFRNASSIRARFATQDAQIADGGIDVTVLGSLQFTKRDTREPVDQAVTFRALVRHADGGWTIRTLQ